MDLTGGAAPSGVESGGVGNNIADASNRTFAQSEESKSYAEEAGIGVGSFHVVLETSVSEPEVGDVGDDGEGLVGASDRNIPLRSGEDAGNGLGSRSELDGKEMSPVFSNDASRIDESACERTPSMLEEAQDFLSISLLIFLLADVRLLSATGRIHTKFETIAVGSDEAAKATASCLAGLPDGLHEVRASNANVGISPAQIMAMLLIEVRKQVEEQKKDNFQENDANIFSTILDPKGGKEVEDGMHALLRAYFKMIGRDIKKTVPNVKASDVHSRRERVGAARSFARRASAVINFRPFTVSPRAPEEEHGNDRTDPDLWRFSRRTNFRMQAKTPAVRVKERMSFLVRQSPGASTGRSQKAIKKYEDVGDAFFQMGGGRKERFDGSLNRVLTEGELLNLMQRAVESRNFDRLAFMADFFNEGSVSQLMVKSKARLVWMNDWYPLKDCTFAVSVDRQKKQVLVVFRGAITRADWDHVRDWDLRKVPNPVREDYEGKRETVELHSGFYRYLFRQRKDTGTTKYDEIANVIHDYGSEMGEYSVAVTGHSLGAALTTVFGLWASTDPRFTKNGPVKMYTFGGPHVAGKTFVYSFRHQERTGKLRLARFYNERDGIAHLPVSWYGEYQHLGVSIKLPYERTLLLKCFQKKHAVWYSKDNDFISFYWRAVKSQYLLNMPLPWNIRKAHTLAELQQRLIHAIAISDDDFSEVSLEQMYKRLVLCEGK